MKRSRWVSPGMAASRLKDPGKSEKTSIATPMTIALPILGMVFLLAWPMGLWWEAPLPETLPVEKGISEEAARSLATKIHVLSSPTSTGPMQPITITEMEANSYLKFRGREFLPPAVHNPEVHIARNGVVTAADVDFDQLGQVGAQNGDWGTRLAALIFTGKQRVEAAGKVETSHGQGRLTIESLNVGTTSIPAGFANFLVGSYVDKKYRIDLSKPFPLPEHVTNIVLGDGFATLYRSPNKVR